MSEIIKSYMGVFLLLLMTLAAGEILAGYMQVLGAQNLHSEILSELEDSNYYSGDRIWGIHYNNSGGVTQDVRWETHKNHIGSCVLLGIIQRAGAASVQRVGIAGRAENRSNIIQCVQGE